MAEPTEDNIYGYNPSIAAAIIFTVLNSIWLGWHTYLAFCLPLSRTHKHRYTIPLFVAAFLSASGWIIRAVSTRDTSSVSLYATSASHIVIAPIFVCATLYLLLKYLVNLCLPAGPEQVLFGINPRWLGRIFISSDVFSFLTQGGGSGIASSGNWQGNLNDIGVNVLLVGLALQLATFTFYIVFMWRFVCRVRHLNAAAFSPAVRQVLFGIWIASAFVQIRTVFRLIEFALGIDSYLFKHEWCLYVFEAVPMWIALGVLAWYHPVTWLQENPRSESVPLTGPKERVQTA